MIKALRPWWSQKASEVKTVHTIQKSIKSYHEGAQVSALSEGIEKLFNILCKFGPLTGPPLYKFGLFWSFCTTVALWGGQICIECWITSQFPQIMQKPGHLEGNFWCSFIWCGLFWPQRLFLVHWDHIVFFTKTRPLLRIWMQKKNVLSVFLLHCSTTFIAEKSGPLC